MDASSKEMPDAEWLAILEKTQEAVYAFARVELASLARRAIYRLQRVKASQIYGDDYKLKSLWDSTATKSRTARTSFSKAHGMIVASIPRETGVLLTILAAHDLDEDMGAELFGSAWREGITAALHNRLAEEAGSRGVGSHRFESWT